jgi:hypothetical protein
MLPVSATNWSSVRLRFRGSIKCRGRGPSLLTGSLWQQKTTGMQTQTVISTAVGGKELTCVQADRTVCTDADELGRHRHGLHNPQQGRTHSTGYHVMRSTTTTAKPRQPERETGRHATCSWESIRKPHAPVVGAHDLLGCLCRLHQVIVGDLGELQHTRQTQHNRSVYHRPSANHCSMRTPQQHPPGTPLLQQHARTQQHAPETLLPTRS